MSRRRPTAAEKRILDENLMRSATSPAWHEIFEKAGTEPYVRSVELTGYGVILKFEGLTFPIAKRLLAVFDQMRAEQEARKAAEPPASEPAQEGQ